MTTNKPRTYVHGYSAASRHMATRQAEAFADFFLPLLKPGMRLLDLGCGPGSITLGLADAVAPGEVIGVDIASGEIEKAKAAATEVGLTNISFRQADAMSLPFESHSFDAVFSCAMLEHVEDKERAMLEIARMLKPGGVIGLVGGTFQGHLFGFDMPEFPRAWEIFDALVDHSHMDRNFGLKQRRMLRDIGFTDLWQAAWYHDSSGSVGAERFLSDELIERVEALGISTRLEMERLGKLMLEERLKPDHYAYLAWIKTSGRAPLR